MIPPNRKNEFDKISYLTAQNAADAFQWSFIKGLDYYCDDLSIYTAPLLIKNYPKTGNKLFVKKSEFSHNENNKDFCIGFPLFPIVNKLFKSINIYKAILKNNHTNNPYIIVCAVHTPYLLAAVRYKIKFPQARICLIVPDLPQYMSDKNDITYRLLKKIDMVIICNLIKRVDSFVFLTNLMSEKINIGSKPWIKIEGIYDQDLEIETNRSFYDENNNERTILYTGSLSVRYGILDLLEAFGMIPDYNYSLWICGDGDAKENIIECSKKDKRVKYFGSLQRREVLKLQKQATVLVNPRRSSGDYTKYSFPSKTMEYLASGKPVIMHHLPGLPDEYLDHIFIPDDETPLGLYKMIINVCNMDASILEDRCFKSKGFIINEKNPIKQMEKLYNLLKITSH